MQLDHRPGTSKYRDPSAIMTVRRYLAEAEKCDVVCANCHMTREHYRRVAGAMRHQLPRTDHPELPF